MKFALLAIGLWFGVHWAYVGIMAAKNVPELTLYWKVILFPAALIGLVLDIVFNLTFGTLMYLEPPREWLFTERCQRWVAVPEDETSELWLYRQRVARFWRRQLNLFDPGHV